MLPERRSSRFVVILHLLVLVSSAMHFDEKQPISKYVSETRQYEVVGVYTRIRPFELNSHYFTLGLRILKQTTRVGVNEVHM